MAAPLSLFPAAGAGLALMAFGAWLNTSSDAILLSLRKGKASQPPSPRPCSRPLFPRSGSAIGS